MDNETEQLNAYDIAETSRYLMGSIKKPEPEMEIMGTPMSELEQAGEQTKDDLYRVVGGGVRDAAQSSIDTGSDLIEVGAFGPAMSLVGKQIKATVPPSRLPEVPEPEGVVASLVRDFVQFGVGMVGSPVGGPASMGKTIVKSAFADGGYFDPAEGGFIRPLIDLGILPEAVDFLAVESNEEDSAAERLLSRFKLSGQGAAIGGAFEGILGGLRAIKNNPAALRAATNTIATATGASALIPSDAEGSPLKRLLKLTKAERDVIKTDIAAQKPKEGTTPATLKEVVTEVERIKNEYAPEDGWLPINVQTGENLKDPAKRNPTFKVDDDGNLEIRWQQPAYAFHIPPGEKLKGPAGKTQLAAHKQNLVDTMTSDVAAVVERAKNGDQGAIEIINQANWYRSMRTRLRQEFGGLADVFADIIGATSAQTNVQQNFDNALQVLRRFTRGDFDDEIELYVSRLESGDPMGSKELNKLHKDENSPFKLITKASGKLFGANSPAATTALLDMFRQIKKDKAPKTINFTGNLIGFGNEATIDVWAARYLRDAAGLPRIPPPAEKAVSGKHLTKSTFDDPQIGAEFGFGQEVFNEAASELNANGVIKQINADLGDVGPDDLQAIVWFLEKEKWTKNGWTTKAGEGGSLDYESVYGGSPDRDRVADLRSLINKKFTPPAKRKKDTDKEYAKRVAEAEATDLKAKNDARSELQTLEGEPQRFTAGISRERPDMVPTNIEQNELAQEVLEPVLKDDKMIGAQATPSIGGFGGVRERNLNFEVVTQVDFDPTNMTRAIVEAGRKYDQDAVFVSKVVPDGTANARPGVEIYFRDRQDVNFAENILKILQDKGVDGFTFITDARQADRASVQALGDQPTAALTGIRFQYIPEFDDAFNGNNLDDRVVEMEKVFRDAMDEIGEIPGITYADVVHYDTTVYKNTDRPGNEGMIGGTSYEEYLGSNVGTSIKRGQDGGKLFSEAAP